MTTLEKAGRAERIAIVFDGERWHVRRIREIEHDLDRDEKIYRCDEPISSGHATLADVPEVAAIAAAAISAALLDPSDEVVEAVSRALSRIGGDPTEGDWRTWEPETRAALRAAGAKITGRE